MGGCVEGGGGEGALTFGGREWGVAQKRESLDFQRLASQVTIPELIVASISALFPAFFLSDELSKSGSNK